MKTRDYIEIEEKYGAHNYHPLDIIIEKGEGVWVYDIEGNKYLDFLSAYSAVNQGHCHPRIIRSLTEQAQKLTLTSRAFRNNQLAYFYQELAELCEMEMVLPMNTGAEAVETAIKTARKWGCKKKGVPDGKAEIIVCENNFHGRTTTIVGFSTEEQYRDGFGPFTPGFVVVPFGNADAIEKAITPNTVAVIIEPIQGEGGIRMPSENYLSEVRRICDENALLLILDEIQTGMGRTGQLFAYEHFSIKPDIITLAKGLGGGVAIGAILAKEAVAASFQPGTHASTFGGNPLACAAAIATIETLLEDGFLLDSCRRAGKYFLNKFENLKKEFPSGIIDVRGLGLMLGLELTKTGGPIVEACRKRGILINCTSGNVLRFTPPLIVVEKEIDHLMDVLENIFERQLQ